MNELPLVLKSVACVAMPLSSCSRRAGACQQDAPVFPDFALEELSLRSSWLTLQSAPFDQWLKRQTKAEDLKHSKECTWIVPQHILDLLPERVRGLMPVGEDGRLRVLRDLDLVELLRGRSEANEMGKTCGPGSNRA